MKSGTHGDPDNPAPSADPRTVVIDMTQATPAWREVAPMAFPRAYHNLTILADGTVLATGGERTGQGNNVGQAVYEAELWNPATETWSTMARLQRPRLYHSGALLLPDGRVLMAGGNLGTYFEPDAEISVHRVLKRDAVARALTIGLDEPVEHSQRARLAEKQLGEVRFAQPAGEPVADLDADLLGEAVPRHRRGEVHLAEAALADEPIELVAAPRLGAVRRTGGREGRRAGRAVVDVAGVARAPVGDGRRLRGHAVRGRLGRTFKLSSASPCRQFHPTILRPTLVRLVVCHRLRPPLERPGWSAQR